MYLSHWGLRESPFRGDLNLEFYHESMIQEEALARLHYLVEERRRLGLLLGDPGVGKSLMLEAFARQMRAAHAQVGKLRLVGVSSEEFPGLLAAQLGLNLPIESSTAKLWRAIGDRLIENRYQRLSTLILLDDADEAGGAVLDQVCRLLEAEQSPEGRLTVVLSAQSARLGRLGLRLLELAELRIDLNAWEAEDTAHYVRRSIERAGRRASLFDASALHRLHELSSGIPRRVQQLADLALLAGAGRELHEIKAETIDSVYEELGVAGPV